VVGKDVGLLKENLAVRGPIDFIDGDLVLTGLAPHMGGTEEATLPGRTGTAGVEQLKGPSVETPCPDDSTSARRGTEVVVRSNLCRRGLVAVRSSDGGRPTRRLSKQRVLVIVTQLHHHGPARSLGTTPAAE
jgi:hypothetical protein